ncbi:MAG: SGNH/GDSL hydrolase family protein [Nocardioides sp.]|nr:SGNH/GDSL hydrolase family protein [Nocardioides sp.]
MDPVRYVAIGDSFSEGVGDDRPDGGVRGWADLVAQGWASSGTPVEYANLAIRGKLIGSIVEEQLPAALALQPTHLSFNAGGNDMMRPRADAHAIAALYEHVLEQCDAAGVQLILLSGANPSAHLPMGRLFQARGDRLTSLVEARLGHRDDIVRAYNWPDGTFASRRFWSADRLHLNARGHHRVAARVLDALGVGAPSEWWDLPSFTAPDGPSGAAYYAEYVGPWVRRRLTGRSSGDGRPAKHPMWVDPDMLDGLDC